MWITRKRFDKIQEMAETRLKGEERKRIEEQNAHTEKYIILRRLLSAFMFDDLSIDTVEIDGVGDVIVIAPKELKKCKVEIRFTPKEKG